MDKVIDLIKLKHINLKLFSRNLSSIPNPSVIGPILRVHRAQSKYYLNSIQINADVNIKSSWVLFSIGGLLSPISSSKFTFSKKDCEKLTGVRNFTYEYFIGISSKKKNADFDGYGILCEREKN